MPPTQDAGIQVLTENLLNGDGVDLPQRSISKWMWQNVRQGSGPDLEGRPIPLYSRGMNMHPLL